jgi:hypothetical protein
MPGPVPGPARLGNAHKKEFLVSDQAREGRTPNFKRIARMSFSAQLTLIGERFSPHSTPLKPWTKVQIDAFTKSDPVNGKRLQALRNAGLISYATGCVGFLAGATVFFRRNGTFNGGAVAAIIGIYECTGCLYLCWY